MKRVVFTQQGFDQLQQDYQKLLDSRPLAVKDLAKAREMGDLSENGYYKAARMKLSDIDRQIRQKKQLLKIALVKQSAASGTIDIGSTVVVQAQNQTKTFHIVGTYEANPSMGKISSSSPLGSLLLGKKKGDVVVLALGETKIVYTIHDML